jgi:hypothetical protein
VSRLPDSVRLVYNLNDQDLRLAIRAYLDVDKDVQMEVEYDSYGNSCEAEVYITVKEPVI